MNDAEGSIKTVDASTGTFGPERLARLDELAPSALEQLAQ
jgi:hypothetical protein